MATQYVQHISGQGEKYELVVGDATHIHAWQAHSKRNEPWWLYLPKSDYVLCEPTEKWVDVTAECVDGFSNGCTLLAEKGHFVGLNDVARIEPGYRFRKVKVKDICDKAWAFIVERKEPA